MNDPDKGFYEVTSEVGDVVLGATVTTTAHELAQSYADLWQRRTRLIEVPFLHVGDHQPWDAAQVHEIAQFDPRPLDEDARAALHRRLGPMPPELTESAEAEIDGYYRLNAEAWDKDDMAAAVGRIVIARVQAHGTDDPVVPAVIRWMTDGLTAAELRLFHAETGGAFELTDSGEPSPDDRPA